MTDDRSATIRAMLYRGEVQEGYSAAWRWREKSPEEAEPLFLSGLSAAMLGRVSEGIQLIEAAVQREGRGEYQAQLARLYTAVRRDRQAAEALQAAERSPPEDALSRDTIGCVYARLGDHAASVPHFTAAVEKEPDNDSFRYNLAAALSFVGRVDDAEAELERLVGRSPQDARAHHLLSGLRKQTPERNHAERLTQTLASESAPRERLLLGYALAKELDDIGRPMEAFQVLSDANRQHRATLPYRFADDAAVFDAIEEYWSDAPDATASTNSSDGPIVVVGMPRTGTTLVDRILSSHWQVESAGELQAFPLAVKFASGTRSRNVLDVDTVRAAAVRDVAGIGRDYSQRASSHVSGLKPRFIDKFPGNFLYAGLIARALPGARIVCLRRNPLDTVLANYRNLFATTSRYYDYSYDLLDIAAYYQRFDRLMAHWNRVIPGRVLQVHYERLVDDQQAETERLLAHCELAWSDACLNFHANAGPVSTPSAAQVRRPIYRDAVQRWRKHADALAPARRFLEEHGINVE